MPELSGACDCRKPAPGMLLDAARELGLDLAASWMVGDTDADVAAGAGRGLPHGADRVPGSAHKRAGDAGPDLLAAGLRRRRRASFSAPRLSSIGRHTARETSAVGAALDIVAPVLDQISTSIFADGADLDGILALAADPRIAGSRPIRR